MREGLRSNARQKTERELLDLNKEPSDNKMPSSNSPSSTAYFSAEEDGKDVTSSVNLDISRNAADDIGKGETDGVATSEGVMGKAEPHLTLTNEGLIGQEASGAEPVGCGDNAADVGASGAKISSEAVGKKRRGRKRKVVVVTDGPSGDGDVELESAKFAKIGEGGSNGKVLDDGHAADMGGDVAPDAGRQEASKGRRGRKRKLLESSSGNKASEDIGNGGEKLAVNDGPQVVGRVLRSRTMAATDGEKQAYREGNAGVGDQKSELDRYHSYKISAKAESYASVQPARKGRKILKGRRGRPPKMQGKSGTQKVTVGRKSKIASQRNINPPRGKVMKGLNLVKENKKKVTSGLSIAEKMGRNEEKQLLRSQIVNILKEAGWTIEYRPRMTKEYLDAVYVDHRGKTYWSVTLAYKTLKQMVEDGTADAKAISAFTPIPENELSKLYRIVKEKGKAGGSKTGKGPGKTSTARSTALSECEANSNAKPHLGEKSSRKNKVDSSDQENAAAFSGRRKSRSRSEGRRKPCALLARCSENDHDADGIKMYKGKRTLLSWMIDWGTVSPGGKVQYMSQKRTALLLEGKITREGISCDCCGEIVTFVDFESHAGSTMGQPYTNIFLESGLSLLQCMRESWSKQEDTDNIGFRYVNVDGDDPHDDTCNVCADGGDLTCCDGCPSTFHHSCLQMQNSPVGYWRCVYCSCKFCGKVCGRVSSSDNGPDLGDDYIDDFESFTCYFCQEKFHVHCRLEKDEVEIHSEDLSFCGRGCQKVFEHLQKLVGVKHELEAGYSWTILHRQDFGMNISCDADSSEIACNSKLAIAFSIMDECFESIIDSRTNINVIQSVIYSCGSNFRRLNYRRFYTFILERGDEIVSAAAIRVHGNQLAEMPFIGTRVSYRRQGMCRRLFTAIEMALSFLDVEKLVIPAVPELSETWTKVFGFVPFEESKRQEMKYASMIAFPGTDMLQKPMSKNQAAEGRIFAIGTQLSEPPIQRVDWAAESVEADAGNKTDGCLKYDENGVANGVECAISSMDKNCHDSVGPLELCTGHRC